MNKFGQQTTSTSLPPAATNYADKQFLHTFLAGLLLPLGQATITAVMAFVATLTLFYLFEAVDLLKPALIAAGIVWVATWLYLMRRWLNITSFERMTGIDLNRDGEIGKPVKRAEPLVIRLDDVRNGNYRSRTMEVDATESQLRELADGLLNGVPFTERVWTGKGKPFSSGQGGSFRRLRAAWLKQGILEVVSDKDNRQGFDFTDEGWAMLAKLAGITIESVVVEEDDLTPLTDEQMEAIENENAAYAGKYQS